MPVIYLGKNLMYPAYSNDNGLIPVEIDAVVDSIFRKYKRTENVEVTMPTANITTANSIVTKSNC